MMRICFVTHKVKKGDGQGRVNYEVIQEAVGQGHEIIIISSEISEDLKDHPLVEWKEVTVKGWPTELLRNQVFAIGATIWLDRLRSRVDLTIVNGFVTYARSDINCIHFVHSAWLASPYHPYQERRSPRSFYQYIYTSLNRYLERKAMKRSRTIVAVSEQVRMELVQYAGIGKERIAVIRNGVDLQEFYPRPVKRANLKLSEDTVYAMFAGDIRSSRKNLDTVLKALTKVHDVHLLVVGWTEGSIYPQMAADLGIEDRVHFLGYRKDMAELMSAADLFVYPSRYEPFALVILEAMATGLPVIASRNCGAVELLNEETAVILDDPDDAVALAEAIRSCVYDRHRLKRMGEQAVHIAGGNSWNAMARHYSQLIDETARKKTFAAAKS
ncbi:glycosyltransferase family 4 protein [Paenibacillus glycanilyticus]|uniref:glycosyltransferase family 4 protein n=1 Tax=Paenibacillus glycanilyticus TaxID=126569 RepID=UPI0019100872|nr:glycosyltransferase family 4 protein [Paenibacillus glycanilyticus]